MYGGRWNPIGVNMVYTSGSIALATLEYLVHNFHLLSTAEICLAKIRIGKTSSILEIKSSELPSGWNRQMHLQLATQQMGKDFYFKGSEYILKVPSAVVPGEFNLLLNPQHKHHAHTKVVEVIDPFTFDQRILEMG
jgi:RES domain-containing protein